MDEGKRGSREHDSGGILSLALLIEEHGGAIEYDLLTRTHYSLDDVGGALSWSSLNSFIKNLDSDSAFAREVNKTMGWETTVKTNDLLANIFDMLQVIHADLVSWGTRGKKKAKVKPYPRPGKEEDKNMRKYGKGALPVDELEAWITGRLKDG